MDINQETLFNMYKQIFKIIIYNTIRNIKYVHNLIYGYIEELYIKSIIEKIFKKCKIIHAKNSLPYDIKVICEDGKEIFIEVKDISIFNKCLKDIKIGRRHKKYCRERLHIDYMVKNIEKGKHYIYVFVDINSNKYFFIHGIRIIPKLYEVRLISYYDMKKIIKSFKKGIKSDGKT